jgi:hypothetical protein
VPKIRYWNYREVGFEDVLAWSQGKEVVEKNMMAFPDSCEAYGVRLSDDSQVMCASQWSHPRYGDLSEVDTDPPRFWIGEPVYG